MDMHFVRSRVVNPDLKSEAQCDVEAHLLFSILKGELKQVRDATKAKVKAVIVKAAQDEQIVVHGRKVSKISDITEAWKSNYKQKGMAEKLWKCLYGVKDNFISLYEYETDIMRSLGWAYICGEDETSKWPYSNGCVAPLVTEAFNMIRKLVLNPGKNIHGWTVCIAADRSPSAKLTTGEPIKAKSPNYIRRIKCVFDASKFLKHKDGISYEMFGAVRTVVRDIYAIP
jgi:hypothetical protein